MIAAASKALDQLLSVPFRTVLFRSLALTLGLLIAAIVGLTTLLGALVVLPGWLETLIQVAGGLGLVVASVFLVAPISSAIAGLFLDEIAGRVERAHYPHDPPGRELPLAEGLWLSAKFALVVLGVNVCVLLLLLLPGINVLAFFVANGYLLGREYFELAALRHMPLAEAKRLRRAHRGRIFLSGLMIAALVSVPVLNLLTPLVATAFMVHIYKDIARRAAAPLAQGERGKGAAT